MIRDFAMGEEITAFFVLESIKIAPYDKGERLDVILSDASGRIEGVVWDKVHELYAELKETEVVKVRAFVSSFRDKPQLKVDKIRAASDGEYDISDLLKVVPGGVEKQIELFDQIVSTVSDPFLSDLLHRFRADKDLFEPYSASPAGKRFHHAYVGGLIQHSVSMAMLASKACENYPELDRDFVVCAALFHDVGKIFELSHGIRKGYTDPGYLIGHIILGDQTVTGLISQIPEFPEKLEDKLRHALLSHHGAREKGSPVVPQTREAFILNLIDEIDAGLNVFQKYQEKTDGDWSEWINLWGRYLYFG